MRLVAICLLLCGALVTSAFAATSTSLTSAMRDGLAGEWRGSPASDHGACGADASAGDFRFTIEFAVTGGQLFFDDGGEDAGPAAITSASYKDGHVVLDLDGKDQWILEGPGRSELANDNRARSLGARGRRCLSPLPPTGGSECH